MNIKTKILISNAALVVSAVLITMFSVSYILSYGIDQQTETLLSDLRAQSFQRIRTGNKLLQRFVDEHVLHLKRVTAAFCNDEGTREGIINGQWKSLSAHAESVCKRAKIDFLVIFDAQGRIQTCWPPQIDAQYPETHFKKLPLFKKFEKYLDDENLVDIPVFSLFERWSRKVYKAYGIDIDDESSIAVLSAGVVPNDYFDEPIGFVLTGIKNSRLFAPLEEFLQSTGQVSLLVDGNNPLAWAGFSGEKNDVQKTLQSFGLDQTQRPLLKGSMDDFTHAGHEYNILAAPLVQFSSPTTSVSAEAEPVLVIVGEPVGLFLEASQKIKQESDKTQEYVLTSSLLVALFVLALTALVANIIGRKISQPIVLAADISDKIASGDLDHVLDESSPDETGRLFGSMNKMIKNLKDLIAENERQMKALRESKERNETLLAAIQEGVILIDADTHNIIDVNPAAASMINAERRDIIGKSYHSFISAYEEAEGANGRNEPLAGYAHEALLTNDGNQLSILKAVVPIALEGRQCLLMSFVDITPLKEAQEERQKLESQLQQAKKMEAIGLLAGGVAHDLNNVLSGIVSYPDLLLLELPEDSPIREAIMTIKESGTRAAAIVQDLLTLARRGIPDFEVVNLNDIIDVYLHSPEYEKLRSFHPEIQVETDFAADILNIKGSPVHLSKTMMNIVSNAAEAMPCGGKITISTENRYIDRPLKGYDEVKMGDYVVVTVSDTGVGISSEDMERIFEPFYTKKIMGRSGTGLGLAVVWGTVKDHKGYIDVQTAGQGKGAVFTLYFPVTREELIQKSAKLSIDEYMGNGQSILVVDDVKEQRQVAERILSHLGYQVATVSSGEQALEYLQTTSVDLLVLDMIMAPGIDGLDTFKQVLEINPKQKAIIASGFSETERVKEAEKLGVGQYIKKPYTLEKIGIAVRDELKKPS